MCRYYVTPEVGNSHFYSASPDECAATAAAHPVDWIYESQSPDGRAQEQAHAQAWRDQANARSLYPGIRPKAAQESFPCVFSERGFADALPEELGSPDGDSLGLPPGSTEQRTPRERESHDCGEVSSAAVRYR